MFDLSDPRIVKAAMDGVTDPEKVSSTLRIWKKTASEISRLVNAIEAEEKASRDRVAKLTAAIRAAQASCSHPVREYSRMDTQSDTQAICLVCGHNSEARRCRGSDGYDG